MTAAAQRPGGRSARVRREVLAATLAVLLEQGLDATTIPAIAERSGVHHTSIYRRWKDRGALIREAALSAVDAAAPVPDTGNLRSDLIAGLDEVRHLLSSPLGTLLLDVARSRDDELDELRRTYWDGRLDHCAVIVERAVARGELSPATDHRLLFELLIGPIHARILLSPDTLNDLKTAAVIDAVLNGVARSERSDESRSTCSQSR
jgi:AcrR family transcriptional regulator